MIWIVFMIMLVVYVVWGMSLASDDSKKPDASEKPDVESVDFKMDAIVCIDEFIRVHQAHGRRNIKSYYYTGDPSKTDPNDPHMKRDILGDIGCSFWRNGDQLEYCANLDKILEILYNRIWKGDKKWKRARLKLARKAIEANFFHTTIPIDSIEAWSVQESFYSYTYTSGGGTKPVNVGRVVMGALMLGEMGAIMGAMPEQEPVKTETGSGVSYSVGLIYRPEWSDRNIVCLLSGDTREVFDRLIPEKRFRDPEEAEKAGADVEPYKYRLPSGLDPILDEELSCAIYAHERLVQLRDLHNDGLITDKEYEVRKIEILSEI